MQKQSSNANDTGYFIMIFLNLTFLFIVSVIVAFLTLPMKHDGWLSEAGEASQTLCGPFKEGEAAQEPIESYIEKYEFTSTAYTLLRFYPFLWLVGILLITLFFFKRNHALLLKTFVKEKDEEYEI